MRQRVAVLVALTLLGCDETAAAPDGSVDDAALPPTIGVRFDPAGDGFYRMPWPSDARLSAAGTPDMSDFPNRRRILEPPLAEIEASVRGFATMPVVYVGLTSAVRDASLPQGLAAMAPQSEIQLVDLSEEGCGARLPLEVAFAPDGDELRDDDVLQIANAVGTVLTPGRPYGLIVLSSFGAAESRSTPRPPAFDAALRDTAGGDALSRSLEPLRRCLPDAGVDLDEVAVATVFTPQDPASEMQALRDFVMDPDRLETRPVIGWEYSEDWSRPRRLRVVTHTAQVEMPIFQDGATPYEMEGGALVFDDAGQPVVQRWEPVDIAVSAGALEEPFGGPRPVLVFMDGTGWTPWGHINDNWIREALAAGYVVMSFMPQFHGGRAGVEGDTETLTFNLLNPAAVRSNFRQQAAETSYFIRLIRERIAGLAGLPELDTDALVYGGHSQGALCGAITAAVEDQYRGYVFNGLSSYLTFTVLHREDIIDFAAVVSLLYRYQGELDRWSPLLQMMQLGGEVVDPHNYVRRWHGWPAHPAGNHVFVSNGYEDATTTPRGIEHMTMAADMPPIAPPGWDIDPVGVWGGAPVALPVMGNARSMSDAALTIATYLDANTGHGTIYGRALVRELSVGFWDTARAGVARLSSRAEYQCGDGADEDLDGMIDCADPDCAELAPCSEASCDDGDDDDGDGDIDCADSDCRDARACGEMACGDGADDDGDGAIDCADSDCASRAPCAEASCADGADDDGDGAIDCADTDCAASDACRERACTNGVDDDGDGAIDCMDPDCAANARCPELACDDGRDEDMNGLIDCADPDCAEFPACMRAREVVCTGGADDDGDGAIDCADADCAISPSCDTTSCADVDLGAQTGIRLFRGTLVGARNDYPPGDCVAFGRGGGAPDVTLRWTAPEAGDYVVSTHGSRFDTVLSVLEDGCDPATELACDDDDGSLVTSELTVTLEAGQSVVIVVGAFDRDTEVGPFDLHVYRAPR